MWRQCSQRGGHRVIVRTCAAIQHPFPFRRDDEERRTGRIAVDIIALMDALKIDEAVLGAFDWGARTAKHRGSALARARQGDGLGERYLIGQPGGGRGALPSAESAWSWPVGGVYDTTTAVRSGWQIWAPCPASWLPIR